MKLEEIAARRLKLRVLVAAPQPIPNLIPQELRDEISKNFCYLRRSGTVYHLLRMTHLLLKCLFVTVFYCFHSMVWFSDWFFSFTPAFLLIHRLNGVFLKWGHSFLFHSHAFFIVGLSTFVLSLYLKSSYFPCVGFMRDKSSGFVRNYLLYLLNATDLTLLNTLLARTGHTRPPGNYMWTHVSADTFSLKLGSKRSSREVTGARTKCGCTEH